MPSKTTAGRIAKSRRATKRQVPPGQQHHKNYRWESFSSKIGKLHSLDPLHKVRRHDVDAAAAGGGDDAEELAATTSNFRNGLERWSDLNLTRGFTAFRRAVSPLCDSLAQILHFEARIMDALEGAIRAAGCDNEDEADREALEPLLDLLTAFAHDLGARFVARGYDARAFALLVEVARNNRGGGGRRKRAADQAADQAAAKTAAETAARTTVKTAAKTAAKTNDKTNDKTSDKTSDKDKTDKPRAKQTQNLELDAAVIEWTFTSLAFLLKYLSRLLVPDLRPTFDILAPLLGRPDPGAKDRGRALGQGRGHMARFTAEALSFLVRMTANPSRRDAALPRIIDHVRDDLLGVVASAAAPAGATFRGKQATAAALYTQGVMALFAEATKGPSETLRLSAAELFAGLVHAIPAAELDPATPSTATTWSDVCCGVLTSMVHHASPQALQSVVEAVLADAAAATKKVAAAAARAKKTATTADSSSTGTTAPTSKTPAGSSANPWRLSIYVRMLGVLAGVRGGAKLQDWSALVPALAQLVDTMAALTPETAWPADADLVWRHVVVNIAMVWHHAPLAELRRPEALASLTRSLDRAPALARWFVPLCALAAALDGAKLHASQLHAAFQVFVARHWRDDGNEDVLCAVLANPSASAGQAALFPLKLPQSWQDSIVHTFDQLEATPFPERGVYGQDPATWRDRCLPKYAALLGGLLAQPGVSVAAATPARIAELLLRKLRLALRPTSPALANTYETVFIVAQGFRAYLHMTRTLLRGTPDAGLRPLLRAAAPRFARRTGLLEALLEYEEAVGGGPEEAAAALPATEEDPSPTAPLIDALVANLALPSHALRLVSLQLLTRVGGIAAGDAAAPALGASAALANMLQVEQLGFAPQNVRNIAAHLRKLAQAYAHVAAGSWVQAAIPAFLFGMLSVPLAPVWDDAVKALQAVAETSRAGEDAVAGLALDWLEVPLPSRTAGDKNGGSTPTPTHFPPSDFECFKYQRLQSMAQQTAAVAADPSAVMLAAFRAKLEAVAVHTGFERGKALRVLAAMPAVAEKRSRRLVPHLLSWTEEAVGEVEEVGEGEEGEEGEEEGDEEEDDDQKEDENDKEDAEEAADAADDNGADDARGWSFADKKALVTVFSLFTNAQALYQSERAHAALLQLLGSGDLALQRLALKALLAWRNDGVAAYRERLERLLSGEASTFKNELTLMLQADDAAGTNSGILPEHRAGLLPVLLRLLYGRAIAKQGAASGRRGLHATRRFVIRHLDVDALGGFLGVALGRLQGVRVVDAAGRLSEALFPPAGLEAAGLLPPRKLVGVLNMLEAIIGELGTNATPYLDDLVHATLYCLFYACRMLNREEAFRGVSPADSDSDGGNDDAFTPVANASLFRAAKTAGLRCLCALFRNAPTDAAVWDWTPLRAAIVGEVVSPGIARLAQETTQGVSWTWRLLATWAALPHCAAPFLGADARILPQVLASLAAKAKDAIKIFAMGVVTSLVGLADSRPDVLSALLLPNMDTALVRLDGLLRSTTADGAEISRPLLDACVDTVVALAPLVQATPHVRSLVDIATWLLNQPSRRVSPRVKGGLLVVLERFIKLSSDNGSDNGADHDADLQKVFTTIASLFSFFKDRDNRQTLCRVLAVLAAARRDASLQAAARLAADLNAYVAGQLDQPDYDRRLAAFGTIARPAAGVAAFTASQWLPLLHNLLFYVRVDEEYGILAVNAADGLCRFVREATDGATHVPRSASEHDAQLAGYLQSLVLPALYAGARDPSETVRREVARTLSVLVASLRAWPPVAELSPLVAEAVEEATTTEAGGGSMDMDVTDAADAADATPQNPLTNILSPVVAKQMQAMQVLEGVSTRHALGSRHVSQFFVPFLEHFVFGREAGADDHGLGAQAANTIAVLARSLAWPQYRALLRRFLGYVEARPEQQKQVVRLLDRVVDSVAQAAAAQAAQAAHAAQAEHAEQQEERDGATQNATSALASTLPSPAKLADEVLNTLAPPLMAHLHGKDEETVSARVPVAIILVKLLNLLPADGERDVRLGAVLTDVCHILRSKAWEAREMARDTLARIAAILGAPCFGFVLRELRGALTRGSQLHVLSYTVHSLLLAVPLRPGDLDDCVDGLMAVVMDDVFGAAGEEKDAAGYVSQMKEVKASKSQDSLELLARTVSVRQLGRLVAPLHALLGERITKTVAGKIDTLLARVASGLAQNGGVSGAGAGAGAPPDVLVFCYEVIQDVYRRRASAPSDRKIDPRVRRFLFVKTERNNAGPGQRKAGSFTYKLVQFALDVLRAVLRKHDALRTAAHVAGFVPVLGDAVLDGEPEVKISAYKLLVVLAKVEFPPPKDDAAGDSPSAQFTGLYQLATKEAVKTVSAAASTTGDLAQAALKLVSVVLRSRHADVPVRAAAVDALLAKLKDDLTKPLFRHVTFAFVRAVLDRRVASPAVYDTLDYVGTVMVTNDDADTRDLARRAFFQFLREYPQQRKRWERQLAFLVANFRYPREGGRLSAMETVYMLLLKTTSALHDPAAAAADPFVQDIIGACVLPLVSVLANDDSAKCRRVAAAQLAAMLAMAKRTALNDLLRTFRGWLAADPAADLGALKMGLELFGLYFGAVGDDDTTPVTQLPSAALSTTQTQDILDVLARVAALLADAPGVPPKRQVRRAPVYAKLVATALDTVHAAVVRFPVLALDRARDEQAEDAGGGLWRGIEQCLWHGTHAVRMAAMRLIGVYLADFRSKERTPAGGFVGSYGMTLGDDDVARLVRGCLSVLSAQRDDGLDPAEADEAAKMLVHLGRYLQPEPEDVDDDDDDDDDDGEEKEDEDEDEDEDDGNDKGQPVDATHKPVDRRYVLVRLALVIRRETPPRTAALVPKAAAMAVLEAFCRPASPSSFDALSVVATRAILRPLRNLTDTAIAPAVAADPSFGTQLHDLKVRAQTLMDTLQKRLGTAAYTQALLAVGAAARARRQQRAAKRKIGAVADPAKHGRDKRKKLERKKERRKVRGQEHRGVRQGY